MKRQIVIPKEIIQNIIDVNHITVSYNGTDNVLDDISLQVTEGEWILITGPSGCGKTTLARVICGLIPHAISALISGDLKVDGAENLKLPLDQITQHVGMVFQNPGSQLFHLTVEEEIAFGPRNLGLSDEEVQNRVSWIIGEMELEELRGKRPDKLSNGQKQLVAISAVLAMQPNVLVLDEPTASLDISSTNILMNALAMMNDRYGITIVMIEHRLTSLINNVNRVYVMNAGRIVVEGSPKQVFSDPILRKTYGLRRLVEEPMSLWHTLIKKDGHKDPTEQCLLRFENVNAGYDGNTVIKNINFSIYPGEFVSLVGANGAGKSTLGLVAAGLLKPKNGKVVYRAGMSSKPGLDIALLFQNPQIQLFTNSVDEELSFAPKNYDCFDLKNHNTLLEKADLVALAEKHPMKLSLGQQLRTALASCVAIQPRLVILDEPTLGQDWEHLSRLMNYLKALNLNGTAILLISHDYKLVHRYSQKVLLMEGGEIILDGQLTHE